MLAALDLGSVRQGERLIHGGIPWRVDALNMYCDFSNPDLTGGTMRLPVKELFGLHSRPADSKESSRRRIKWWCCGSGEA
jgi:hypothetical protein